MILIPEYVKHLQQNMQISTIVNFVKVGKLNTVQYFCVSQIKRNTD